MSMCGASFSSIPQESNGCGGNGATNPTSNTDVYYGLDMSCTRGWGADDEAPRASQSVLQDLRHFERFEELPGLFDCSN